MMNDCRNCANVDNEYCFACDNGNQFKPMTNAERIRSKNDQELAEWICSLIIDRYIGVPVTEWLNWLKEEADNGRAGF